MYRQIAGMTGIAHRQDVDGLRRTATSAELAAANINPRTGLATDYLNHFNEAVMLLEMIPDMPDCTQDFLDWRPLSYTEHFAASKFVGRDLAIRAYRDGDALVRAEFDSIIGTMTTILREVSAAMRVAQHDSTRADLAHLATVWVKPMVATAGGVINGGPGIATENDDAHADIDALMAQG